MKKDIPKPPMIPESTEDKILAELKGKIIDVAVKDKPDNLIIRFTNGSVISVNYCCLGGVDVYDESEVLR